MAFSRAISSSLGCNACRNAIVRTFLSPINGNASISSRTFATTSTRHLPRASTGRPRPVRRVGVPPPDTEPGYDFLESANSPSVAQEELATAAVKTGHEAVEPAHEAIEPAQKNITPIEESANPIAEPVDPSQDTSPLIPWYLQVHAARQQSSTPPEVTAREALPELPNYPPPLLQPLLEYISITSGMDDLTLLDLRHLDPPPALGPNLIMLLCTARSEKHLHVSADRLCRHLRREFSVRANADGLLGRNELKIKLRRKAKRMKMLANIGGREPEGNIDDGIRTGWICVSMGKLEAHPEDKYGQGLMSSAEKEGFVGFREVKPGVNVVVQMFTQEKREEVDLETLWNGVLRTAERESKKVEDEKEAAAEEEEDVEVGEQESAEVLEELGSEREPPSSTLSGPGNNTVPLTRWKRRTPTQGDLFPPASNANSAQQLRRLHGVGLRSAP